MVPKDVVKKALWILVPLSVVCAAFGLAVLTGNAGNRSIAEMTVSDLWWIVFGHAVLIGILANR